MLTLIVPVRDWPVQRIEASIKSFVALRSRHLTDIVVVDFGSARKFRLHLKVKPEVRLFRVSASEWSLAEAINAGVLASSNQVLAKIDADTLISPDSRDEFDRTVERVGRGELGLAVSQFIDLPNTVPLEDAVEAAQQDLEVPQKLRPKWGQGALVFFSRPAWQHIGGLESRFTGWGNEDNDFYERMRMAGHRVGWTDRDQLKCYHVWHPPTFAKTGILAHRQRNIELAKSDRSVLRPIRFPHSNARKLAAPAAVKSLHPLVSLAVATTSRPGRLKMITEALESFRGQVGNDIEIVAVDNGSSQGDLLSLRKKLEAMTWAAAVRVEHISESSIPKARNIATDLSRGRYLAVVDDDDIALPNRLADHLKAFERDGLIHGSHGGWIDFDEHSGIIERNQGKERKLATLLRGTGKVTCHPASFYRTDVLKRVRYDESYLLGSDWDLALRMAMMGIEVAHTRSFVTLRRFHATNVTITGQSNQVVRGLQARARQAMALGWRESEGLQEIAKTVNDEVYCSNTMSLAAVVEKLPGYAGEWHLFVPVAALRGETDGEVDADAETDTLRESGGSYSPVDRSRLERLYRKTDGALCTRLSGLNQSIYFRTKPIRGAAKATAAKKALEALVDAPIDLCAVRQSELDRTTPFNWAALKLEAGSRRLRSEPFRDCAEALLARAKLAAKLELRNATSLVSDCDEDGECYYLLTPRIKGRQDIELMQFRLQKATGITFAQIGSGAVETDLLPGGKNH